MTVRLLQWCTASNNSWCGYQGVMRAGKALSYCTQTLTSYSAPQDTLYKRISPNGDPRVSILPILDQWVEEGKPVKIDELKTMIKLLRNYRRVEHALQLSEWMSERRYLDHSPGYVAVRLDLICRVHGLEEAEKYFDNIPNTLKTFKVYGALLNCYAYSKSLERAEAIMQKMREMGFMKTLSYNVMLNLYSKMGKHEKLDTLIQEMEEKGISLDNATFYIRLNSYSAVSDMEGMEKLLLKMEANPLITMDWNAYIVVANGYLKGGLVEKAFEMLKKAEKHIREGRRGFSYEILLTMYASIAKKDELYRVWNLYKIKGKILNSGYFYMISSLIKLDDVDGAEKIFKEWESVNASFDFRILNLLINAYGRQGLLGKAEAIVSRAIENGKEPPASTWDCLASIYYKDKQMQKAVDTMKKAVLADQYGWKLNRVVLKGCLRHLKKKGDVEGTEKFVRLLREHGHFSQLSLTAPDGIENGSSGFRALNELEGDDVELHGETKMTMGIEYANNGPAGYKAHRLTRR
ncbi:unnamed protein product [Ilex paraguariensis]|uniref:Pentatricopeptide repeat-containing protein n=1 Tax=Ilex paraguariensis TaxID=185542 RepID=A0ABC8UD85_9AQUA